MDIYFDYSYLLSFIRSAKMDKYEDCARMLKDNFILHFSFSKTDIEGFCEDDKNDIDAWIRSMDVLVEDIKWEDKTFEDSFNPKDFEKDKEKLMSVYCLNNSQKYADSGLLLIASLGNEVNTLSSLFIEGNQYTKNVFQKVKRWDELSCYVSPTTDIIIVDQFVLSNPELNKSNLYSIINNLCKKSINQKISIVIFTLKECRNADSGVSFAPDWDKIYTDIRSCAKFRCRPNVSFVTVSKDVLNEHDRSIFTNYKVFSSGDTFNYFNSKGERVTDGRWLHVHSCADKDNENDAKVLIDDLQKIVDHIKNNLRNPNLILKDKVSNFIDF